MLLCRSAKVCGQSASVPPLACIVLLPNLEAPQGSASLLESPSEGILVHWADGRLDGFGT